MAEAAAAGDLPSGVYRPWVAGKNVYGEAYIGHPTLDMSPLSADGTYVLCQNVPYEWALHMDDNVADHGTANQPVKARQAARRTCRKQRRFAGDGAPTGSRWLAPS
jgi:hypothetical protein